MTGRTDREDDLVRRAKIVAVALMDSRLEDRGPILARALMTPGADTASIANVLRATVELLDVAEARRVSALN